METQNSHYSVLRLCSIQQRYVAFYFLAGAGSVARSISAYIDSLAGNRIEAYMMSTMTMDMGILAKYPDFIALGLCLLLTSMV